MGGEGGQAKCVRLRARGMGGGGGGGSRLRTYAKKKFFLNHKISNLFLFCTKEAITLPFIIVYIKA